MIQILMQDSLGMMQAVQQHPQVEHLHLKQQQHQQQVERQQHQPAEQRLQHKISMLKVLQVQHLLWLKQEQQALR
jgi:hypothetical protein